MHSARTRAVSAAVTSSMLRLLQVRPLLSRKVKLASFLRRGLPLCWRVRLIGTKNESVPTFTSALCMRHDAQLQAVRESYLLYTAVWKLSNGEVGRSHELPCTCG